MKKYLPLLLLFLVPVVALADETISTGSAAGTIGAYFTGGTHDAYQKFSPTNSHSGANVTLDVASGRGGTTIPGTISSFILDSSGTLLYTGSTITAPTLNAACGTPTTLSFTFGNTNLTGGATYYYELTYSGTITTEAEMCGGSGPFSAGIGSSISAASGNSLGANGDVTVTDTSALSKVAVQSGKAKITSGMIKVQ